MGFTFALISGVTFALVPASLCKHIVKVWKRGTPPQFDLAPMFSHWLRFLLWALLAAACLQSDPWISGMFLVTRAPAARLVSVLLTQRRVARPAPAQLLS